MNMRNWLNGKITWNAPTDPAPGGAEPVVPATTPEPEATPSAPDLSFVPEAFHKDGQPDIEAFKAHYAELTAPKEIPDAYEYVIPEGLDLGLPEGMELALTLDDPTVKPLLSELDATLKEIGAPKEVGAKIGGLLARYEATKLNALMQEQVKEFEQLGTAEQANARIANVIRAMEASLPADQVSALQGVTKSAKALMAMEKLLGPKNLQPPNPAPKSVEDDLKAYYSTPTR